MLELDGLRQSKQAADRALASIQSAGQLWFSRLLPSTADNAEDAICFGAPYVLCNAVDTWQAFIRRESWKQQKKNVSYDTLLKIGVTPTYWLEYITQAYLGTNSNVTAIYLQGVPDQSNTRPHAGIDSSGKILPDHSATIASLEN